MFDEIMIERKKKKKGPNGNDVQVPAGTDILMSVGTSAHFRAGITMSAEL